MPASMWANGAMWAGSSSCTSTRAWSAASAQRRDGIDDLEEAGDGLLLSDSEGVARGDAGAVGELVSG